MIFSEKERLENVLSMVFAEITTKLKRLYPKHHAQKRATTRAVTLWKQYEQREMCDDSTDLSQNCFANVEIVSWGWASLDEGGVLEYWDHSGNIDI